MSRNIAYMVYLPARACVSPTRTTLDGGRQAASDARRRSSTRTTNWLAGEEQLIQICNATLKRTNKNLAEEPKEHRCYGKEDTREQSYKFSIVVLMVTICSNTPCHRSIPCLRGCSPQLLLNARAIGRACHQCPNRGGSNSQISALRT